jgi:hypothetical protein
MSNRTPHRRAAVIEGAAGGVAVVAGLVLAALGDSWPLAFWLVVLGAACVGHAVTFGFGLIELPSERKEADDETSHRL